MFIPFKPKPGINKEGTAYSAQGGWFDCNFVRFRTGLPEKVGGWVKYSFNAFYGVCRALFAWTDLNVTSHIAVGTNLKYYVVTGGAVDDITPLRRTVTLGANPIITKSGQSVITVNDPLNGAIQGDFTILGGFAGSYNGIPASNLNGEFPILSIVDANNFTVDTKFRATASGATGGTTLTAAYEINTGQNAATVSPGYGAGGFGGTSNNGNSGWGQASLSTVVVGGVRLWSQTNFGEDLLFCPRGGSLYYWASDPPSPRAFRVTTMANASDVPIAVNEIMVTYNSRQCMAFGCNPLGQSTLDPMMIRWSDNESTVNWTPTITNAAGGQRISYGSQIVTAVQTHTEIVVFTDTALYSAQLVGSPFIWGFFLISPNVAIAGPNAKVNLRDTVYWMGIDNFYVYNGQTAVLPCTVKDYVFRNLNANQLSKVYGGSNKAFNEIWWFYPSSACDENDSYVAYNYVENLWFVGKICRTAWMDFSFTNKPIAAFVDGFLYSHETAHDDGSTSPPSPIISYIQSAPIEGDGTGDKYIFIDRVIPDVTFKGTTGTVNMILTPQDYPGDPYKTANTASVTEIPSNSIFGNETFTREIYVRLRGRSMIFEMNSNTLGVDWRLGTPRINVRPDGRR